MYYSAKTGGLYHPDVHPVRPSDAVELSASEYKELIRGCAAGQVIVADSIGRPVLAERDEGSPEDNSEKIYQRQLTAINAGCEAAITGGFWSSVLGGRHRYSSQLEDQLNLTGIIVADLDSLYPCRDEQDVKAFRPHTAAQLREVNNDFVRHKLGLLQSANTLKSQLDAALAAGDITALEQVKWSETA